MLNNQPKPKPRETTIDDLIFQYRDTIEVMEAKMNKLNQIINVKDEKIRILEERIERLGI